MKAIPILSLLLTATTMAAEVPKELTTLRSSYHRACERATLTARQKFLQVLTRLKEDFTRAGKLEQALAADAAIKALTANPTPINE